MTERLTFAAGHVPGVLVAVVLGAVVLLALVEAWAVFRRPRVATARRWSAAILGLRLAAIVALLAIAFEVSLRIESVSPVGRRLVVLIDASASMALTDRPTEDGDPAVRLRRAQRLWEKSQSARDSWEDAGLTLDVRAFDGDSRPVAGEAAKTLEVDPVGVGSDLGGALASLADTDPTGSAPLSGVVVLSDGLVAQSQSDDAHLIAVAEQLEVPVTTVAAGASAIRDVSVAEVRAGEFAFVENVAEFEASIVAHGLSGERAKVELRRDGEEVSTRRIRLGPDGVAKPVRFEVAPDRVGQFVYEIAVEEQPDEATTDNNRRAFVVKVLRDKVRVLHVAGRPDWDVRALRTLLRRDPNVELLSYYILRGFDDIHREDSEAPLSLIPFPTEELFEEELGSFDLVILHNFDAMRHAVGEYLGNMSQYVLDGGALVLIGGDLGLAEGGYASRAMTSVLPVDTRRPSTLQREPMRPTVTEAGQRHPITAWLQPDTADGTGGWSALPELDTYNPLSLSAEADRIGAIALLTHPTERDRQGEPRPILAVAEPGRGRTMVLGTGSTWRLGFAPDLALIDGARPYDLLWLGAVRWLLRDDSSGRVQLETDQPRYAQGQPVQLRAKTLTASYAPEPDVMVAWEIVPVTPDEEPPPPIASGTWTTDGLGRARQTVQNLDVGAYAAVARRTLGDTGLTSGETIGAHEVRRVFIVEPPARELARIDADPGTNRLARVAEATDGRALVAAAGDTLPADIPLAEPANAPPGGRVDARTDIPLWNGWLSLALLILAFGGEWIIRRRRGEV